MFAALADAAPFDIFAQIQNFQDNHTFLQGIVVALLSRYVVLEIRRRVEKPVMDEVTRRASEKAQKELTVDTEAIQLLDWAKLPVCIVLDLAGDASQALPILGEFTDLAYAPAEAAALKLLFQSNAIAGFGFAEEILPFTDVIPTFTLAWSLQNLFGNTPLAKKLLPDKN
jgi:hypothetical protein